jgi:ribonuclease HI
MSAFTNGGMERKRCQKRGAKVFYIDGAGSGPDGTGSGFGWVRPFTGKQRITWIDGLTSNEAEYRGLLGVLKYVACGSCVLILTDSQLVANQFTGKFGVYEPRLRRLLDKAKTLVAEKELDVEVRWIRRTRNLAGCLMDRSARPGA